MADRFFHLDGLKLNSSHTTIDLCGCAQDKDVELYVEKNRSGDYCVYLSLDEAKELRSRLGRVIQWLEVIQWMEDIK